MKPTTVVAIITPVPGGMDALVAAYRTVAAQVHEEPGCLLYSAHSDGEHLVMIESWRSRADLDAHAHGAAVARLEELRAGKVAERVLYVLDEVPVPCAAKSVLGINRP